MKKISAKRVIILVVAAMLSGAILYGVSSFLRPEPAKTSDTVQIAEFPKCGDVVCYREAYKQFVSTQGALAAFEDIKQRYETDESVKSLCHPLMHVIGQGAAQEFTNVSAAFAKGDSFCWSGYYHGVLEAFVSRIGLNRLVSELDNICSGIADKVAYGFDYYNCVHGLGHGIMVVRANNVFKSLDTCDNLSGSWEQQSCWSGVFMENIIIDTQGYTSEYLKKDDPLYPCNAVDEKYKTICYLMQTSYMLKVFDYDYGKVFAACATVGPHAAICYQSLGRDASGQSISNAERTREICMSGVTIEQRSNCIIGAIKDFISYFHSDTQANELCASITQELRQTCYDTVKSYYELF